MGRECREQHLYSFSPFSAPSNYGGYFYLEFLIQSFMLFNKIELFLLNAYSGLPRKFRKWELYLNNSCNLER